MTTFSVDNRLNQIHPRQPADGSTILVINNDLVNSILVDNNRSMGTADAIGPLNTMVLDAAEDWYASCPVSNKIVSVTVRKKASAFTVSPLQQAQQLIANGLATEATLQDVLTGVGDTVSTLGSPAQDGSVLGVQTVLGTPAQDGSVSGLGTSIPNNIAGTGAPLLALANVFSNPGGQTFTAGQTRVYGGPSAFPQISYEIFVFLSSNASETNPVFQVELDWFNAASGQTIAVERWFLNGGISPGGNTYVGTGRAKGDTLQVSITNKGSLTSGNCQVVIMQSSRLYVKDDFRSTFYGGTPGIPSGTYDTDANVLLATTPTVGPGVTTQRSLAMYAGTVRLFGVTQVGNIGSAVVTVNTNDTSLANSGVFQQSIAASSFINSQFDLPRKQCTVSIQNNGGSSQAISVGVYVSEQNV